MEKQTFSVNQEAAQTRVDVFLTQQLEGFSRTAIQKLIIEGRVGVNAKPIKPHHCLRAGDEVSIELPVKQESSLSAENIVLDIVYEDEDVIVINKPSGMVVHPGAGNTTGTLVNALLSHTKELSSINKERPGIVHRLDKETSGLLVVAKNNPTHLALAKQFRKHSIKRRYIALVQGQVTFKEGVIDAPIGRHPFQKKKMAVSFDSRTKEAQTNYRVLKRFPAFSLVELFPKTGRTHQLRVHLAYLEHPILGDSKYGNKDDFPRLALHAKDLGFFHPRKKEFVEFTSEVPLEIRRVIGNVSFQTPPHPAG